MGNPHESRPRMTVGLDIGILHILQLKGPHTRPVEDKEKDKHHDFVEMGEELQQLFHPEVDRLLVVGTYIGDLLPVDCLVEHTSRKNLHPAL